MADDFGISEAVAGVFDLAEAGVNAFAGSVASKKQYKRALALMKQQQDWAEYAAKHAHQWEVEDLRAAGLNPLLSIDTSGAVAHTSGTPSLSAPDYSTVDFSQSAKYLSGEKKRERELKELLIENAKKQGKSIDAETAKKGAETARILKHTAEGIGTPQQTKNAIYDFISDMYSFGRGVADDLDKTREDYTERFNNLLRAEQKKRQYERSKDK